MNKPLGIVIILLSTICYAVISPLLKKSNEQVQPFTLMAISMFVLFALSLVAAIFFENGLHIKTAVMKGNLPMLVIAGAINFVGFWLAIRGYQYMPLWQQTMFTLLTPVVTGIASYFLLGEVLTSHLFIGLVIIGIGLFIAVR